jgi:ATP-binding cassette, subfamily B (MDR/TAP), member 1
MVAFTALFRFATG